MGGGESCIWVTTIRWLGGYADSELGVNIEDGRLSSVIIGWNSESHVRPMKPLSILT